MANYTILNEKYSRHSTDKTLVVTIDGETSSTINEFYKNIAQAMLFPDYFGRNIDSFDEIMSDLEWLKETNIHLIFKNYDNFLSEENDDIREIILTILDETAEEWKRKDEDAKKLRMYVEPSDLIEDDLTTLGIEFNDQTES
jgi:RNAse (barnase) inhibitor barstar